MCESPVDRTLLASGGRTPPVRRRSHNEAWASPRVLVTMRRPDAFRHLDAPLWMTVPTADYAHLRMALRCRTVRARTSALRPHDRRETNHDRDTEPSAGDDSRNPQHDPTPLLSISVTSCRHAASVTPYRQVASVISERSRSPLIRTCARAPSVAPTESNLLKRDAYADAGRGSRADRAVRSAPGGRGQPRLAPRGTEEARQSVALIEKEHSE